jgi:hypothetical protein
MIYYVLELRMHVCVHVKTMQLCWDLMIMWWNWECTCMFILKPCNSVGIWWYIMCWNWECMCVFMLKPCNYVGIWWYIMCWNWKCMCVFCSEFLIRCQNWVVCSELAFAAESVFYRNWVVCNKLTFTMINT